MKNPILSGVAPRGALLALCWSLFATAAVAGEVPASAHVPLQSMTQTEYEIYRQQLGEQVKGVASNTREANLEAAGVSPSTSTQAATEDVKPAGSGYGKGYRARMERGGSSGRGGGYRGGAMNRGGGRNR